MELQAELDQQLEELGQKAIERLAPGAGERILDIGCGCGQTTLELARRVGPAGYVVGVDVSQPMLSLARQRASQLGFTNVDLRLLDAQEDALAGLELDAAYSRFGVMFFADPARAFQNILSALRAGGRMSFVCWRALIDNPWMSEPLEAARSLLPPQPPTEPLAPGPYAFADPARIRSILTQAGFGDLSIEPHDALVGGGSLDGTVTLSLRVGPLGHVLRERPEFAPVVRDAVATALSRFDTGHGIRMPAAVWVVCARRPEL